MGEMSHVTVSMKGSTAKVTWQTQSTQFIGPLLVTQPKLYGEGCGSVGSCSCSTSLVEMRFFMLPLSKIRR
eukprot:Gb_02970 [translate_table: standard]